LRGDFFQASAVLEPEHHALVVEFGEADVVATFANWQTSFSKNVVPPDREGVAVGVHERFKSHRPDV
jgi:hypothetical protein